MSNMSYCKFENTLNDLRQCEEEIGDEAECREEEAARKKLIALCKRIADQYAEEE